MIKPASELSCVAQAAIAVAADYASDDLSPATLRAYRSDWRDFCLWCSYASLDPLPAAPTTVAAYLASMAHSYGRATIRRRLAAIGQLHRFRGFGWTPWHPAIRNTCRGMFRQHGAPERKSAALCTAEIRRLVATCDDSLTGIRDRSLLLLGFAGALRRSELVGLWREHLTFTGEGVRLLIPRSKGDPEANGIEIGIPRGKHNETCTIRALEAWLSASDCQFGPVFRKIDMWGNIDHHALQPNAVNRILRRRADLAALSPGPLERLSSHGLRAGFVTEAYRAGARDEEIMAHTRHADLKTMRGYVRRAKLLADSPAKLLGL